MTTIKDLLNDFAEEIRVEYQKLTLAKLQNNNVDINTEWKQLKEDKIDEYIETIKGRIVG